MKGTCSCVGRAHRTLGEAPCTSQGLLCKVEERALLEGPRKVRQVFSGPAASPPVALLALSAACGPLAPGASLAQP